MGKRIVALFSTLIFLFSAMIWRLSWISRKEDFAQAANQQSTYTLEVSQSRGMIYDCQGQSLVNDSFHYLAAVLPSNESAAALRSQFASADLWREKMSGRVPFFDRSGHGCSTRRKCGSLFSAEPLFDGLHCAPYCWIRRC